MAVEIDIEALLKTVDEFADRAEDSRNFTWFAKSNSLWRSAMKESAVLKGIDEQLVGKLKIPKMGILILLTISTMDFLCYICTSENLVFNQFVDILFFFIVLICMSSNVLKLWVEIKYLSLLRVRGLMWFSQSWKSPGKVHKNCFWKRVRTLIIIITIVFIAER